MTSQGDQPAQGLSAGPHASTEPGAPQRDAAVLVRLPHGLGFSAAPAWWPLPMLLPLTSVLLASLLVGSDAVAAMPLVIVAVAVAYVAAARLVPSPAR